MTSYKLLASGKFCWQQNWKSGMNASTTFLHLSPLSPSFPQSPSLDLSLEIQPLILKIISFQLSNVTYFANWVITPPLNSSVIFSDVIALNLCGTELLNPVTWDVIECVESIHKTLRTPSYFCRSHAPCWCHLSCSNLTFSLSIITSVRLKGSVSSGSKETHDHVIFSSHFSVKNRFNDIQ